MHCCMMCITWPRALMAASLTFRFRNIVHFYSFSKNSLLDFSRVPLMLRPLKTSLFALLSLTFTPDLSPFTPGPESAEWQLHHVYSECDSLNNSKIVCCHGDMKSSWKTPTPPFITTRQHANYMPSTCYTRTAARNQFSVKGSPCSPSTALCGYYFKK